MSMTITEKILARSAGLKEVVHGQRIKVTPHYTAWYDATATKRMLQTWRDIGLTKMADSDKKAFFIDPRHRMKMRHRCSQTPVHSINNLESAS